MSRNFGIVTGGIASGAQPQPRPHSLHDTQQDSNVVRLPVRSPPLAARSNSRAAYFNVGAGFFFLAVVLTPLALVALGYLALAPQSIEYLSSVETNRLKGH